MCVFCVNIRLFFCARCVDFSYVYGLSFAQVVWILHIYTAFCARWAAFDLLKYWFSDLEGSLICYCLCNQSFLIEIFDYPIFRVLLGSFSAWAVCYDCIVWKIQFLGFCQVLYPTSCLWFNFQAGLYDWTVSRIRYLCVCRVIYPTICLRFTVRSYLVSFLLILIEQYIYLGGVILLCTILIYGRYKCKYKGYLGCNYNILD